MFFSVIVPIYKVENYLVRCIESVLGQTFGDFELILVDDGSSDSCPGICDAFAETDSRIKVIHKENGGLVSARKAGIKLASGEYVFNLDGDDALTADALEAAHEIILSDNPDIVSFSLFRYKNGDLGDRIDDEAEEGFYNRRDIKEKLFPKILLDENMKHIIYFLSGKAVRRELVTKLQLAVDDSISLGEDLCCTVQCYINAGSVYISRKAVYLYTTRTDSMSTDFDAKHILQIAKVVKYLKSLKIPEPHDFEKQIARYSCFMCFVTLAAAAENGRPEAINDLKRYISESVNRDEILKAEFGRITLKSRITVALIKKNRFRAAFRFLHFCKILKGLGVGK